MDINPRNVVFNPPYEEVNTTTVRLSNTTNHTLLYKVKTTSPNIYCVRPNASAIAAGHSKDINITRQSKPVKGAENSKDKFLILSAACVGDEVPDNVAEIWSELEKNRDTNKIEAQKLRVIYTGKLDDPVDEKSQTATDVNQSANGGGASAIGVAGVGAGAGAGAAGLSSGSAGKNQDALFSTPSSRGPDSATRDYAHYGDQQLPQSQQYQQSPSHLGGSSNHGQDSSFLGQQSPSNNLSSDTGNHEHKLTVDDIQGTPGVPPKSKLIQEGDAKTGPKLANSNLPEGPKAEHGLDPKFAEEERKAGRLHDSPRGASGDARGSTYSSPDSRYTNTRIDTNNSGSLTQNAGEYAESAKNTAGGYAESAKNTAGEYAVAAAGATGAAAGAAAGALGNAASAVNNWVSSGSQSTTDSRSKVGIPGTPLNPSSYDSSNASGTSNSKAPYAGGFETIVNGAGFESAPASNSKERSFAGGPKFERAAEHTSGAGATGVASGVGTDVHPGVGSGVGSGVDSGVGSGRDFVSGSGIGSSSSTSSKPSYSAHDPKQVAAASSGIGAGPLGAADVNKVASNVSPEQRDGSGLSQFDGRNSDSKSSDLPKQYDSSSSGHDSKIAAAGVGAAGVGAAGSSPSGYTDRSISGSTSGTTSHPTGTVNGINVDDYKSKNRDTGVTAGSHSSSANAYEDSTSGLRNRGPESQLGSSSRSTDARGFEKAVSGTAASAGGAYSNREPESATINREFPSSHSDSYTSTGSSTAVGSQQTNDVPLNVTVLLVIISFLIGWKFF